MLVTMSRELRIVGAVEPVLAASLGWVGTLDTLEDVLRRPLSIVEVIVQDEYTHDVITRHDDVYVVFDTT